MEKMNKAATILWNANADGQYEKYGQFTKGEPPTITASDVSHYMKWNPVSVLKQAKCYAYQACEVGRWRDSEAKRLTDEIMHNAIIQLPGYDDAPWGI
jgi:hypothetical protein